MEGERLRTARERELMLTIKEIDGVEAVRVHLAEPQQSVFVREEEPAFRLGHGAPRQGRQLSDIAGDGDRQPGGQFGPGLVDNAAPHRSPAPGSVD